jgi:ankyrin repeat protein
MSLTENIGLRGASMVKKLIEEGADIHYNDEENLRWASGYASIDTVKILLDHGANVHAKSDEPLKIACRYGRLDVVKLLVEHGATVDNKAIAVAKIHDKLDVIEYLEKQILLEKINELS